MQSVQFGGFQPIGAYNFCTNIAHFASYRFSRLYSLGMKDYLQLILLHKMDNPQINRILNEALIDDGCSAEDFAYLQTVAKSLGFSFAEDFFLANKK